MAFLGISFSAMIIAFSLSILALANDKDGNGFWIWSVVYGVTAGIVTFAALCLMV